MWGSGDFTMFNWEDEKKKGEKQVRRCGFNLKTEKKKKGMTSTKKKGKQMQTLYLLNNKT